jgi:hypothetical protein
LHLWLWVGGCCCRDKVIYRFDGLFCGFDGGLINYGSFFSHGSVFGNGCLFDWGRYFSGRCFFNCGGFFDCRSLFDYDRFRFCYRFLSGNFLNSRSWGCLFRSILSCLRLFSGCRFRSWRFWLFSGRWWRFSFSRLLGRWRDFFGFGRSLFCGWFTLDGWFFRCRVWFGLGRSRVSL